MTLTIVLLAAAYALVVALLVTLLLSTRVPLALRVFATVAAVVLMTATYRGIGELRGMPSDSPLPRHFQLHWALIVEPNKLTKERGYVYLWVEELDKDGFPSGRPRAYSLPYSDELAKQIEAVMAQIEEGQQIEGQVQEVTEENTTQRMLQSVERAERNEQSTRNLVDFVFDFGSLTFGPLSGPSRPEKE